MLTISHDAAHAIRGILADPEVPDSAGLRISMSPAAEHPSVPEFQLRLAEQPSEGDQVVDENGAQVFLGPAEASVLSDAVLDVRVEPTGERGFAIIERE